MLTVPLGVVEVCQAGTSLAQPQSNVAVPPRLQSTTSSPSSPISPASSVIATSGAPVRLAIATVSPTWSRVAVGEQQRRRRHLVGGGRGLRVAGQERIDQNGGVAV